MRPYQLATQTTNTHNKQNKQFTVHTAARVNQNDQDTKRYTTLQTSHTTRTPTTQRAKGSHVCDARVHYPIIKQQETNQLLRHPTECRRLMPQTPNSAPYHLLATHPRGAKLPDSVGRRCVPLVNTPNRSPTFVDRHGVCSLERR